MVQSRNLQNCCLIWLVWINPGYSVLVKIKACLRLDGMDGTWRKGEYVSFLASDDRYEKQYLEQCLAHGGKT
jgi:hypothetical protein